MASIKSRRDAKPEVGMAPPKQKSAPIHLPHTKLPPSFQKPSLVSQRLPPKESHGYGPQPSRGETPNSAGDPEEELSEAQQQLHKLLAKQLNTMTSSVESALTNRREFTPAVVYQPVTEERQGLTTLSEFIAREEEVDQAESLRQLGLTQAEIDLKQLMEDVPVTKRRRLRAEPVAQQDRLDAVNQKISERLQMMEEPTTFHSARQMSRHAMEVERSLFRGSERGNPLDHLTREETEHQVQAYPKSIMPVSSEPGKSATNSPDHTHIPEEPARVPRQVIERNCLSEAEIRAIPRFKNHQLGTPNKVLYVKNLHCSVSADDLRALFSEAVSVRVMTGRRMRGQAFIEFDSVTSASEALNLVNGYKIKDRPVIISYRQTNSN